MGLHAPPAEIPFPPGPEDGRLGIDSPENEDSHSEVGEMLERKPQSPIPYRRPSRDITSMEPDSFKVERRKSQIRMEDFVNMQLKAMLIPLVEQVETLHTRLNSVDDHVLRLNAESEQNRDACAMNAADLLGLRGRLHETDGRVAELFHELGEANKRAVQTQQSLDALSADVAQTHERLEHEERGAVPVLQRGLQAAEQQLRDVCADLLEVFSALNDPTTSSRLNTLTAWVEGLKAARDRGDELLARLRADVDETTRGLQETRHQTDKVTSHAADLQRIHEEMLGREAQLSVQLNAWKDQWSKLHPEIQGVSRDLAQLRAKSEHHDAGIFTLQRQFAHNSAGVEALNRGLEACCGQVEALRGELASTNTGLAETRGDVAQTVRLMNLVHTRQDETSETLRVMGDDFKDMARKQALCRQDLDNTTQSLADLRQDHLAGQRRADRMQDELDRTKDNLGAARKDLDKAILGIDRLRDDMTKAKASIQHLDRSLEFVHAGFSGIQKGMLTTGQQVQSRAVVLPAVGSARRGATDSPSDYQLL